MVHRKAFHYKTQRPYRQFKPVRPTPNLSADIVISPPNTLHAVYVLHRSEVGKPVES